ncbi:MAG: hypothetical protein HPY66_2324 [Firmicutes bacterium]|nr:hypothetical protein [Bacillota bacterium]
MGYAYLFTGRRKIGIPRNQIIVSDLDKTPDRHSAMDAVYIKTETESISKAGMFAGTLGLEGESGVVVAVEIPETNSSRVREVMEQSGAVKIIQD